MRLIAQRENKRFQNKALLYFFSGDNNESTQHVCRALFYRKGYISQTMGLRKKAVLLPLDFFGAIDIRHRLTLAVGP